MNVRLLVPIVVALPAALTAFVPSSSVEDNRPSSKAAVSEVVAPIVVKRIGEPADADQAQDAGQAKEAAKRLPLPNDNQALALALLDMQTIPVYERCYFRWLWCVSGEFEEAQVASLVMNYLSQSTLIARPFPIGRDKLLLQRVDLRQYARTDKQLAELITNFEEFRFDPRFNRLYTKDTLRFNFGLDIEPVKKKAKKEVAKGKKWEVRQVPAFIHTDGKQYTAKWFEVDVIEIIEVDELVDDVLRVISPHIDQRLLVPLIDGTGSQCPVVSFDYFLSRAMRQVQDKGLYKTLFGGLYYQLAGIRKGNKVGTDEENLLEQLGVGSVKAKLTAEKIFDGTGSDARIAKWRSDVTGRPRRADLLRSFAGHITENMSLLSITQDPSRETIDIADHPLMNLVRVKVKGKELIAEKSNGLHLFAALNGDGVLQDQVPDTIASDHTIPRPHQTVLEPAISCIRCHGPFGGWQPLVSDVPKLVNPKMLNILDDVTDLQKSTFETVQRLAEQYHGDPEIKLLPRARDDYAGAILRACGPWKESKDQTDVVRRASDKISAIFASYVYDTIDAKRALLEMGVETDGKEEAKDVLKRLLPPMNRVPFAEPVQEDPRIAALFAGQSINRTEWALVYSFVATRAQQSLMRGVKL